MRKAEILIRCTRFNIDKDALDFAANLSEVTGDLAHVAEGWRIRHRSDSLVP